MSKINATTQDHLDIIDVQEHYAILKGGGVCTVLQTTAVNFDLLSEREQDAMITAYAGLLNSLSFPIQIVVRSKRMDISSYIERLDAATTRQVNPYLKQKIKSYKEYIKQLISKNNVLDKRFYVVIPYKDPTYSNQSGGFFGLFGSKQKKSNKRVLLEKARDHIDPKIDHLTKQLSRIGVKAKVLNTQELVELYYDIYNPQVSHDERLKTNVGDYTVPLVEPAVGRGGNTVIPNHQTTTPTKREKTREDTTSLK